MIKNFGFIVTIALVSIECSDIDYANSEIRVSLGELCFVNGFSQEKTLGLCL